jgi:phage shock protein A
METSIYLVTIGLLLGTTLLIFGMKYFSAAFQARARIAGDTAYRVLAEKAVAAEADNRAALAAMQAELSKVAASLAAVEKILKQVE